MVPRALPNLQLPQTDRPNTLSVLGSVLAHAAAVLLIIWLQWTPIIEHTTRRPGLPGDPGGGGVHYIHLDAPAASAPAARQLQPVPAPPPEPVVVPTAILPPVQKLETPVPQALVI